MVITLIQPKECRYIRIVHEEYGKRLFNVAFIFDKKNSDTSERVADTVANMANYLVKQLKTIHKKVLLQWRNH